MNNSRNLILLNAIFLIIFSSFAHAQIEGYWRLDETVTATCGGGQDSCDVTVNNNDGTWNGTVAGSTDYTDKVGTIGSVDLGSGYIDYGDQANHEQNSISLSIWAKPDATGSSGGYLSQLQDDGAGNRAGYGIYQTGGTVHFKVVNAAGSILDLTASVPDTEWHHWGATYDAATGDAILYLDGESIDTDTFGIAGNIGYTFTNASSDNLYVGRFVDADEDFQFSGLLDEARVYSTVLTDTEIGDLAGAGIGSEVGTLDTKHFIPPIYVADSLTGTVSNSVRDHYLWITTDSATAMEVTINDGATINTATPIGIICVRNDNPVMLDLSGGAHSGTGLTDPTNCPNKSNPGTPLGATEYGAKGIVSGAAQVNTVNTADGFILESFSDKRFYANIRQSSGSQGASLTAKGHTALGERFRSGHLLTHTNSAANKAHFISIMALTDDTRITLTPDATVDFLGLANNTAPGPFDLDQYESVVVAVEIDSIQGGDDPNAIIGTLIETSDALGGSDKKLVVINSGSFLAGLAVTDAGAESAGRDAGFDQILPNDYLGTQFVMAKGAGLDNEYIHQRPVVIADQDDTKIFINGSLTPLTTIDEGEYFDIPGCSVDPGFGAPNNTCGVGTSNFPNDVMFVETSEPAAIYQNVMANNSENGQGLNYIPAVFPNLESQEVVIADVDQLGNASVDIIITAGASFTVTGTGCSTGSTNSISGTDLFEIVKVTSCSSDVTIDSPEPFFTSVSVESGNRGAAGFFTGFPNSYAVRDDVTTGKNAAKTISVLENDIKGFFDFFVDSATTPINGGSVVINVDNTITYTPPTDFVGLDVFEYTIEDVTTGFQDTTIVTVSVIEAPGAVADELQVWLKANGNVATSGTDVTAWNNEVPNVNVPNVTPSGTNPELISTDTNFNFNSVIDFQNESLVRSNLDENDLVETSEGTMFVVTTTEDSPLTISSTTTGGTCGANRCSTGFRSTGAQFSAGETTYPALPVAGKANIIGLKADAAAPGNVVSVNGLTNSSTNANGFDTGLLYQIGVGEYNGTTITGRIAEAITYSRSLTDLEFGQVETYLGVKYGVTLDQTTGRDYVDSNGNVVFDAEAGDDFDSYDSDIAGIALDDGSLLDQRKSKSINTGSILTIAHTDLTTPTALDDTLDYLVWGHDGVASSNVVQETIGGTVYERLQRVYRVQNNGSVANNAIEFDLTGLGLELQNTQVALLIDNDLTFSNATLHTTGRTVLGDVVSFTGVNFSDRDYFTLVLQEEPEVNWSAASQNQDENSGNMTFTAGLNYASNLAVSIPYTLSGGADGSDYSITASPASITAGSTTSGTITITVSGDTDVELDDDVVVTMGTVANASKGTTDVHTATINNDDTATVNLSVTTPGLEAGPQNIVYTATMTAQNETGSAITFDFDDDLSGTATSGDDYTAIAGAAQISIPDGSNTGTITVNVTDDGDLEPNIETLDASISNSSNGDVSIGTGSATANITDNDTATVNLSVTTHGNETGPVNIVYTATLTTQNDTGSAITFDFDDDLSGTATSGSDYTAIPGAAQISIANGSSTGTITVNVTNDGDLEADIETLDASISNSSNGDVSIGTGSATANITDNDTATVNLSVTTHGDENGPVNIVYTATLDKQNDTGSAITFDFDDDLSGSATSGDDYTAIAGAAQISIANGSSTGTITVNVTNDVDLETPIETLDASISNSSNADVTIGTSSATANIADDDTVTVNLAATTNGNETGPVNIVYTATLDKQNNTGSAITFDFDDDLTGTATSGSDYVAIPGAAQISIANGATFGTVLVVVNNDSSFEADTETLDASISNPSHPGVILGTTSDTATITDNDVANVNLAATINGNEAGPVNVVFTATLDKQNETGSAITFDFDDDFTGTATSGSDYVAIPPTATVSIANGATFGTVLVVVNDDSDFEAANETLDASISNSSNSDVTIVTAGDTANIADDETATVNLAVTTQGLEAGPQNIVYTATLDKQNDTGSAITFDFDDDLTGSATSGDDYTAIAGAAQISIADGATSGTITVPVTDDSDLEPTTETLDASISNPSHPNVILGTSSGTANITDNDAATVNLSVTTHGNEAGPVNIVYTATLDRQNNTGSAITFDFDDDLSGTATSGDDYTAIAGAAQISIADGATSGTITVNVTDDGELEADTETLDATISNSSNADVTIGTGSATANITDNDTATVNLAVTTQGNEAGPVNIVYTATLDKQNDTGSAITFDFDDDLTGSATSGSDYTAIAGAAQISIADGATSGTITVNVTDDGDLEADIETLDATISNPSNGDVSIGTGSATANITDNDTATVNLSVTTQGNEAGPVNIVYTATLDKQNDTGSAITFDFDDDLSGTATSGDDYTAIAGAAQISIADGATSGTITVNVTDDGELEADTETLDATISNSSNADVTIGTGSATANITDNDTATVNLAVTTQGNEAGPVNIVYTATLDKQNDTGSAITFDFDDDLSGTATSGDDYTAIAGAAQISIADGATSGTITVNVTDDGDLEPTTETLDATISNPSNGDVSIGTGSATANITDNDTATVNLAVTTHGNEAGPVNIVYTATLDKQNDTGSAITFDFDDDLSGTATSGDDYTAIAGAAQISIADGATSGTITVNVTDDGELEADTETLDATISNSSNADVTIGTGSATANITDNDTATVNLAVTTQGDEAGPVNIVYTATLDKQNDTGSAITFDFDDDLTGSATSGSDYTAVAAAAQISIANGATSGTITVNVTDDGDLEPTTETLDATISNPSNGDVSIGTGSATANITDDDTATVNLAATTHGNEAGPVNIVYTATLDKQNDTGSAITFDFDDDLTGSATSGSDYTAIAGAAQISIANGATSGTITVNVTDDGELEADTETLDATISNSSNADVTIGTGSATANITDNDTATVNLAVTTQGDEAGPVNIVYTATLDKQNDTGSAITFDFDDDLSGTATSGDDYTAIAAAAQISIADGATSGTITVNVTDDGDLEADTETLDATISNSSNADIAIGTASDTANITDNDTATVSLSGTTDADEDAPTNGVFTVTLSKQNNTGSTITVDIDPNGGTATVVDDYNDFSGSMVSILDGQTSGTLTVVVVDDPDLEVSPESLEAIISNSSNGDVTIATATASINVIDDDGNADDDSDGIINSEECPTPGSCPDSDGDGIPDYQDDDSDNDGETDDIECTTGIVATCEDADGDGIPDYLEPDNVDTDGDGTNNDQDGDDDNNADRIENADGDDTSDECPAVNAPFNCPDTDGDGIPDYLDVDDSGAGGDSDGDGIPDTEECPSGILCPDSDGDGIPDYNDTDSDNDGEADDLECTTGIVATCEDADGDGIPDYLEPDDVDTDGDGINNDQDGDDDNVADAVEDADGDDTSDECSAPNNPFNCPDTDGDGIPDFLDVDDSGVNAGDSDGDGILDDVECPVGVQCPDSDGDAVPDYMDTDSDGDGIPDATECTVPANCEDADGDGIPDYKEPDVDTDDDGTDDKDDLDSDNDGILDAVEYDTDNDGDGADDTDGDGIPDFLDGDSDGDGVTDADELAADGLDCVPDPTFPDCAVYNANETVGAPTTADPSGDSDGDSIPDAVECPSGLVCPDSDGDGLPDYFDPDSDNDGTPDVNECTVPANCEDADGDGIPDYKEPDTDNDDDGNNNDNDLDSDNDGILDAVEYDTDNDGDGADDTDGDGIPDYLDGDSDGDGVTDADELAADAADCNPDPTAAACAVYNAGEVAGVPTTADPSGDSDGDSIPDAVECPVGLACPDSDGDGLPDYFDPDSDNDGTPDVNECTVPANCEDADGDGIPDYKEPDTDNDDDGNNNDNDLDSDNDGILDAVEYDTDNDGDGADDTDGDSIPDFLDGDSDGDGVTDADELAADAADCNPDPTVAACAVYNSAEVSGVPTTADPSGDSDGDGIPDATECPVGLPCPDTDGDGIPDYFDPDSDGDGIPDSTECTTPPACEDGDMDGIPDYQEPNIDTDGDNDIDPNDLDSDGDGIDDGVEYDTDGDGDGADDTDGDGIPDFLDGDSDGDGVPDADELAADAADCNPDPTVAACAVYNAGEVAGVPTTADPSGDSDGDGIPDATECPVGLLCPDADGDNLPDYLDTDSDNDGETDDIECTTPPACEDADGDGIPDYQEPDINTDGDANDDPDDLDSDGDGIDDAVEYDTDGDGDGPDDTDGDGIPDFLDGDSDGDGVTDAKELAGDAADCNPDPTVAACAVYDPTVQLGGTPTTVDTSGDSDEDSIPDDVECPSGLLCTDTDSDGVPDYMDPDSDGDGIPDSTEVGADPLNPVDSDGDNDPDYKDTDSDNDGIDDDVEGTVDGDNDNIPDYLDDDSDNDGIPDSVETDVDTDGDGINDNRDLDSDNDSILDATEMAIDVDNDGFFNFRDLDSDSDGIMDIDEATASVANAPRSSLNNLDNDNDGQVDDLADQATVADPVDTDGDGIVDVNDADSDGDGIPDSLEAQSTTATRSPTGTDTDGDGIDDAYDVDQQGAVVLVDTDNDGLPDFRDFDSDGDGILDSDEVFDTDGDGIADTVPSGLDADNDGLDDAFDPDFGFVFPVLPDADGDGIPDFRQPNSIENCEINDQTETQLHVDGAASTLLRFAAQAEKFNRRFAARTANCEARSRSKAKQIQANAQDTYDTIWSLTWVDVQSLEYDCEDIPPACTELDLTDELAQIKANTKLLFKNVKQALGAPCVKKSKRGKKLISRAKRRRQAINNKVDTIPNPFLACES